MTPSVIAAHAYWAECALFVWVLANQGGVPIPVMPALLAAGALAGRGSLSVVVTLAVSIAAALCADLTWYLLGRWRGSRALDLLTRLVPRARTLVQCAAHLLLAHERVVQLGARFLPEVNPIAAGLAGAAEMSLSRFLPGAAVSAAVWTGSWIGIGYLLTHGVAGLGIPLTFVGIAMLVGWLLLRPTLRRLLLPTFGRAREGGKPLAMFAMSAAASPDPTIRTRQNDSRFQRVLTPLRFRDREHVTALPPDAIRATPEAGHYPLPKLCPASLGDELPRLRRANMPEARRGG